jgi:transposase-like protein
MVNEIYTVFPSKLLYEDYVFQLKWKGGVVCPFCNSKSNTMMSNFKYHCNSCNSGHSLTVNTIMHNTKLDLRKWLVSIECFLSDEKLSYRRLSSIVEVDKKSAYRILKTFNTLFRTHKLEVVRILGIDSNKEEVLTRVLLINIKQRRY